MKKIRKFLAVVMMTALCLPMVACGKGGESSEGASDGASDGAADSIQEQEKKSEFSDFAGIYRFATGAYYVINDDGSWKSVEPDGTESDPGRCEVEGDVITLYESNDELFGSFAFNEEGNLKITDADYAMEKCESMILLPKPEDALDQVATFEGDIGPVTINYPSSMVVTSDPKMSNTLMFNPVVGAGTDDYASMIVVTFRPMKGYDQYMTQGAGKAKVAMSYLINDLCAQMYGNYLTKSLGADFQDKGNFFSITGFMWLLPSIFAQPPEQPVRGCMEVRYYGPTGYALVATTLAQESRVQNYYDISLKMLDTCSYKADWNTSPKPVPAKPGAAAKPGKSGKPISTPKKQQNTKNAGEKPYYWNDMDGDVWYWNGEENVYIGSGRDYYIDEDGQYVDVNNATYSPDYDDDFDPWSDPGDYATWSDPVEYTDPGDSYDDWSDSGDYSDPGDSYDYSDYSDYSDYGDYSDPGDSYDYSDFGDDW